MSCSLFVTFNVTDGMVRNGGRALKCMFMFICSWCYYVDGFMLCQCLITSMLSRTPLRTRCYISRGSSSVNKSNLNTSRRFPIQLSVLWGRYSWECKSPNQPIARLPLIRRGSTWSRGLIRCSDQAEWGPMGSHWPSPCSDWWSQTAWWVDTNWQSSRNYTNSSLRSLQGMAPRIQNIYSFLILDRLA